MGQGGSWTAAHTHTRTHARTRTHTHPHTHTHTHTRERARARTTSSRHHVIICHTDRDSVITKLTVLKGAMEVNKGK